MTLYASHVISYGLWIVILGLLPKAFFSWYRLSSKNIMVLILTLSMIAYVVNGITGLTSYFDMLTQQKPVVTSTDIAYFPDFSITSLGSQIGLANQIASGVAYVLTWIGTAKLLYPHIKKLGKTKFWTIMGAPMAYYLVSFPLFVLGYFTPSENIDAMTNILIFSLGAIFSGVVFGAAFLSVARTLQKESTLRNHMILARLWVSSLLYRRLSFCCTGSLSSIWTCFCVLYWIIMLSDIFGALFFGGYGISRCLPTPLYKEVCNRAIEVA